MNPAAIFQWAILPISFLIGALPFGAWIVKWRTGKDVRELGSGNIGATNVLRTTGKLEGILTLLLDIFKGIVAVRFAERVSEGNVYWMSAAAVLVLLGHAYSPLMNFKGGKAVASFAGAFLYLTPLPLLSVAVIFVAVVWKSRFISLGSIAGAVSFPFAVWLILHPEWPILAASIFAGAFIAWRHEANWKRIREGNENVFRWKKAS